MDDPEQLPAAELANWLKYYRALGFTHLYRQQPSRPESLRGEMDIEAAPPATAIPVAAAAERDAAHFPSAESPSVLRAEAKPRKPGPESTAAALRS